MTSKPAVQKVTAAVSQRMRASSLPVSAIQAAAGAIPRQKPSTRWEKAVNRLQNEYAKSTIRTTGASRKQSHPSCRAAQMKIKEEANVKPQAKRIESTPAGRWRLAVRRFFASISASKMRLNAIAADRAATMATMIQKNRQANPGI